ncbi:helix-turn-helix domain-containing protein [Parapedobacter koreensis]|uniref:helix-turn-helix domain-containing protein n=1 Tax=Parapedobacter koreensis TaxID=332977 RepID=UPI0021D0171E|nr:helix-turn-helix domain-containing protein [Parapedobacter koreensis]
MDQATPRTLSTEYGDKMEPHRWLQHRRLQEAHYLIKEMGRAPSDVYLEIGFEDLSHFSFAFKKQYGVSPSKLAD